MGAAVGEAFATGLVVLLIAIGLTVPMLVTLRAWLVDGALSGGLALGIVAAVLVGLGAVWHALGTAWAFLWVVGLIAGCAALPLLSGKMNHRARRELANESIARYHDALARDPQNAAAHAYLADAYLECGRVEEAITSYRRAIELDPHHTRLERSKLQKALERHEGRVMRDT